jgi:hypothetical protein
MSHGLLADANFYALLSRFDADLAATTRAKGCRCGGRLDRADFPRKPRGGPADLDTSYAKRIDLCCDACRTRTLPPSVRFLGQRVYLAAVVVLVSAMRHGVSASREAQLGSWLGVNRRTLARWRTWWTETFPRTEFWRSARGRLHGDVITTALPDSLMEQFDAGSESDRLVALLRFIAPVTTALGARISRVE